jgi:hypothetical protein
MQASNDNDHANDFFSTPKVLATKLLEKRKIATPLFSVLRMKATEEYSKNK